MVSKGERKGTDHNGGIHLTPEAEAAACAPILGKLGDVLGRRTTLLLGIAVFTAGNILTAMAYSLVFMLGARFIVGIGTAAIAPIIMAYIVTEYPPEETGKGFAVYMLISSMAVVAGPTCGGLIMQANMTNVILFVSATQPENKIISSFAISILYIGMSIGSVVIGPMADKSEPKSVLTGSLLLTGIGCGMMYFFQADASFAILAGSLGILGVGLGGNATILMKVALSGLSPEAAGSGTGTYGLFRDISAPFGVAVFVPLFANMVTSQAEVFSKEGAAAEIAKSMASVEAIHMLAILEVICVVVGIAAVRMLPKIRRQKNESSESSLARS